jgi:hypothetical protein
MTQVHNSDVLQSLRDTAQLQLGHDNTPNMLSSQIVPTLEINPTLTRLNDAEYESSIAGSGVSTIVTTSTSRDFYCTGVSLSYAKDAACDIASGSLTLTVVLYSGVTKTLIRLALLTLTAQYDSLAVTFAKPYRLARGTTILISGTYTAGSMVRCANVYGYEIANPNG